MDERERLLADHVMVGHCVSVASRSDALLIALLALVIGPRDEATTMLLSFVAAAEAVALVADCSCITRYIGDGNLSVYTQYTPLAGDRDRLARQLESAGIPTAMNCPLTLDRQPALAYRMRVEGGT